MNPTYAIDLSLKPTTFDFWHVSLVATVVILSLILIFVLGLLVVTLLRAKNKPAEQVIHYVDGPTPEPVVTIVEKIVEVEKLVHALAPEPVVLKESNADAALQLLGILQSEARFIDFIKEEIAGYSDSDIGIAARVVHEGCNKAINEHFTLAPVRSEDEGGFVTLQDGFDAASVRLTGDIIGSAPFTGTLIHKGWKITASNLPKLTLGHNAAIIAPAEVEL
ncbi:MAG: DUF2760 domain-containing protein [Methylococcales bacterium]|nr:DUF2760 domain-containing protein [Methylococcales bacterium]